jgi:outer membrane protein assembly factor BamB
MRLPIAFCLSFAVIALVVSCTPKESQTRAEGVAQTGVVAQAQTPQAPAAGGGQAAPATGGSDWPRFRGPSGDGISAETGINKDWAARPPQALWQTRMGDDGYAGPCVADGKVFIIDHQGQEDVVRAIDLGSGRDVWSFRYAQPGGANNGFSHSTPCYDEARLFTIGRAGQLNALNAADGKPIWSKDFQKDFGGRPPSWNFAASPIVDGDRLVVLPAGPDASAAVLDKATGETIWKGGGTFGAGYATPVIATLNGVKQYLVFTGKALTGVKADDGRLLWQVPWETQYGVNAAMPLVEGDTVFATSNYRFGGGLYRIGAGGAEKVWFSQEMQSHFSSPVLYNGHIFGTTDPGDLICMVPSSGKVLWRQNGFEKGGIVIVDDAIIALNGAGGDLIMAAASTDSYQELGRLKPLGGQSWTAPVVAQGRLLIRNKSALACLDLK